MKKRNKKIKIAIECIAALMAAFMLTACAGTNTSQDETVIILNKNGSIQSNIYESFEQSYYDKEELQQMILSEAATYNRQTGNSNISVEKVEEKNGKILVQMSFSDATAYAFYNNETFFVGSPKEAQENGYDLNVVLSSSKNEQDTVGESDILNMEGVKILITDTRDTITYTGKVLYISSNVTLSNKNKNSNLQEDSDQLSYVIFKK